MSLQTKRQIDLKLLVKSVAGSFPLQGNESFDIKIVMWLNTKQISWAWIKTRKQKPTETLFP